MVIASVNGDENESRLFRLPKSSLTGHMHEKLESSRLKLSSPELQHRCLWDERGKEKGKEEEEEKKKGCNCFHGVQVFHCGQS